MEKRKYFVEPHAKIFADFPSVKGKKVLEIGCGLGVFAIGFAKAGAKKVVAVDLSQKSLEIARQNAIACGVEDKIEFHLANAEKLSESLPVEKYDLVFSFGVIHHTPNPSLILKNIRSYLKTDGKLKIMVYHKYSWKVLWILVKYSRIPFKGVQKTVANYSEAKTGCPVTYTYSKKSAKQLLFEHGFKTDKADIDHIFPYRIPDYVRYKYTKVWYFRILPFSVFRFLEKNSVGIFACKPH